MRQPTLSLTSGILLLTGLFLLIGPAALGHVDYVRGDYQEMTTRELVDGIAASPAEASLLLMLPLVVVGLLYLIRRSAIFDNDIRAIERGLDDDIQFIPLLLRLSVGLPLIGGGFMGYAFSPVVTVQMRLVLVTIGFLILFGLATRYIAGVGLLLYLVMLPRHPGLLLAFEFVPGFLSIILMGSGRPSADHLLTHLSSDDSTLYSRIDPVYHGLVRPTRQLLNPYRTYMPVLLRAGLGIAFIYLGIVEKLLEPGEAIAIVHKYSLTAVVPVSPELWVVGAALTEIGIGCLLLLGLYTRLAGVTALFMFTTTLLGLPDDPVMAHTSLFGLVSVLIITGSGPLSADTMLGAAGTTANKLTDVFTDDNDG